MCMVIHQPTEIVEARKWKNLQSVVRIQSERYHLSTHETTQDTRYYICSKLLNATEAIHAVRSHWGIENNLHWVLDMQFREDESRMCSGYSDQNFALLRKIVLNLIALDKNDKMSVGRKRLRASRNDEFRQRLLKI